jgi:putative ABC transport system substrate-binding protein
VTGLTNLSVDLAAKRLELLKEAFPEVSRVGVLYFQTYPGVKLQLEEITRAATILGKTVVSALILQRWIPVLRPACVQFL